VVDAAKLPQGAANATAPPHTNATFNRKADFILGSSEFPDGQDDVTPAPRLYLQFGQLQNK
jgi:hypothetical protein